MKCPNCGDRHVEIDEADGYCQDSRECDICGCVWTFKNEERIIIKIGKLIG